LETFGKLLGYLSTLPSMICELGGLAAAVWLLILGKWELVLACALTVFAAKYLLGIVLTIVELILAAPAHKLLANRHRLAGAPLALLASTATFAISYYWCWFIMYAAAEYLGAEDPLLFLLVAYTVAVTPHIGLMYQEPNDGWGPIIHTTFVMTGFFLFTALLYLSGLSALSALSGVAGRDLAFTVFVCTLLAGALVHAVATIFVKSSPTSPPTHHFWDYYG
jgi:hypothetical protein